MCGIKPVKKHTAALLLITALIILMQLTSCASEAPTEAPTAMPALSVAPKAVVASVVNHSRGYLTTPQELSVIKEKADRGIEPYSSAVANVLAWAEKNWDYPLDANIRCKDKDQDQPAWNDNQGGTPILYAKALAYHLTGSSKYAQDVKSILQRIMTEVKTISITDQQCRINFSWGTPELVASADLIEDFWKTQTCSGPLSTLYDDTTIGSGNCKMLFQNWLVKNPYYVISYSAEDSRSNWGASGTTTTAYIADYLTDRPDVKLIQRNPRQINNGKDSSLSAAEAYAHANKMAINSMNGYAIEYGSSNSCDFLEGSQQNGEMKPVKSQITEKGIIAEDARREEYCNISQYNGKYQNYPQLHLGDTIQQCELMLRRGDSSCYDNVDNSDIPTYSFVDPNGTTQTTHLYPGRGSIERAIKAIIVDSNTEWKRTSALEVAYHYYYDHHTLPGFERWFDDLNGHRPGDCSQDICFGTLTHGFAVGEHPNPPPTVPPPQ
jgi:hypothetical protein